jgi:NAD(P)-dependent dehydrogenase (short-subunit alcohol dehydrogenase family)
MASLKNKVAIITGATAGLGRATALLFAREGAGVVLNGRRAAELEALVGEIRAAGGQAEGIAGDVTHEDTAAALVERARSRFGRLDIGFNNVGGFTGVGPTPGLDLQTWNAAIALNLTSAFLGAKHQIPAMIDTGGGSLIFSGGYLGTAFALPWTAAYASGKAALVGLARSLAVEFGAHRIRANVLVPGSVDTEAFRAANDTAAKVAFFARLNALNRVASPEEIAHSALYLASDGSAFTTGSTLFADGGVSTSRFFGPAHGAVDP